MMSYIAHCGADMYGGDTLPLGALLHSVDAPIFPRWPDEGATIEAIHPLK